MSADNVSSGDPQYGRALETLRSVLSSAKVASSVFQQITEARDEVIAHFQPVFSPERVSRIEKDTFKAFLLFKNNKHWSGLHRTGYGACADMDRLRETLADLLDESKPISERLDRAMGSVKGMGRAILTAILLIAYPDRYGVWNNTSEAGLKSLQIWPTFRSGVTVGDRYVQVNEILERSAADLETDLWTLDALFWVLVAEPPKPQDEPEEHYFVLEKHLQDFLWDNWDKVERLKDWKLYTTPDNPDAGYEYPCRVGLIDILAKHRSEDRWLVVELKRNQSDDATVGQVLRYMGAVREELAKPHDEVEGLIISRSSDVSICYALKVVGNVKLMRYKVSFDLEEAI